MRGAPRITLRLVFITLAMMTLASVPASPQCAQFSPNYPGSPWPGESVGVLAGAGVHAGQISGAIKIWYRCCGDHFDDQALPALLANQVGTRTILVRRQATSPLPGQCGKFSGHTIIVYSFAKLHGSRFQCGAAERVIAHELGHVLGLADAPATPLCRDNIMAGIPIGEGPTPEVSRAECLLAAQANAPRAGR